MAVQDSNEVWRHLLEVAVLVHVDQGDALASREDEPEILILRLALAQDGVTRQSDAAALVNLTARVRTQHHRMIHVCTHGARCPVGLAALMAAAVTITTATHAAACTAARAADINAHTAAAAATERETLIDGSVGRAVDVNDREPRKEAKQELDVRRLCKTIRSGE